MWSYEHFIWSAGASVFLFQYMMKRGIFAPIQYYLIVALAGGIFGVLIDLDHFLISKIKTGNWNDLVNVIKNPDRLLGKQNNVFAEENVKPQERLITHAIIIVIIGVWALSFNAGLSTFIYWIGINHILADLLRDGDYI